MFFHAFLPVCVFFTRAMPNSEREFGTASNLRRCPFSRDVGLRYDLPFWVCSCSYAQEQALT